MNEYWLVAIVVVLLAAAAAIYVLQRQRSHQLRTHFGPEYDHALEGFGERRAAERALRDRARRVDKLEIRPLTALRRDELWARWQGVQAPVADDRTARDGTEDRAGSPNGGASSWQELKSRFVDDPQAAVAAAEQLVQRAVDERVRALQDEASAICARERDENEAGSTEALRA